MQADQNMQVVYSAHVYSVHYSYIVAENPTSVDQRKSTIRFKTMAVPRPCEKENPNWLLFLPIHGKYVSNLQLGYFFKINYMEEVKLTQETQNECAIAFQEFKAKVKELHDQWHDIEYIMRTAIAYSTFDFSTGTNDPKRAYAVMMGYVFDVTNVSHE